MYVIPLKLRKKSYNYSAVVAAGLTVGDNFTVVLVPVVGVVVWAGTGGTVLTGAAGVLAGSGVTVDAGGVAGLLFRSQPVWQSQLELNKVLRSMFLRLA